MDLDKARVNKINAQHSTGPKTAEGKIVASANAVKHGLLAKMQVLPNLERQREWNAHFQLVLTGFAPEGYLETSLAEKIALQLWRLKRVAQYEREVAAIGLETVDITVEEESESESLPTRYEWNDSAISVRQAISRIQGELTFITTLTERHDDEPLDAGRAAELIEELAEEQDVDIFDDPTVTFPDYADGARLEDVNWTAGYLKTCLSVICQHGGSHLDDALATRENARRHELQKAVERLKSLELQAERSRRRQIIPSTLELEKITRYEAHLERSLYRALHELQRVQANRKGQMVPPPQAVDVDVAVGLSA